ncbi:protein Flattop [Diachasmimorpha longicaudata]|uniref:protein Flattop n=1 Tax=Diachasmimorpha longicaudata TaxID=58733 RepID=UPI0030B88623
MSQHWHGHWTDDTFKPRRLCNWQVPNWHPKWPARHCRITKVQVDDSGRFLPGVRRPQSSPWGNFKGTWDLPLKITRQTATELSSPPKYQFDKWEAHLRKNRVDCERPRGTKGKTHPLRR